MKKSLKILIPTTNSWQLWEIQTGWSKLIKEYINTENITDFKTKKSITGLAYPSHFQNNFPVWINSPKNDLKSVAKIQSEQIIQKNSPKKNSNFSQYRWQTIQTDNSNPNRHLISISKIDENALSIFNKQNLKFDTYLFSSDLIKYPNNKAIIWQELKKLITCFTHNNKIVYISPLSSINIENAISETITIARQLKVKNIVTNLSGITIWDIKVNRIQLEKKHNISIESLSKPKPHLNKKLGLFLTNIDKNVNNPQFSVYNSLIPQEIKTKILNSKKSAQKKKQILLALAILITITLLAAIVLFAKSQSVSKIETTAANYFLKSKSAQKGKDKWDKYKGIFDKNSMPLEILLQLTSTNAFKDILISNFDYKPDAIIIKANTKKSTAQNRFLKEISRNSVLKNFSWSFTSSNNQDGAISFTIKGESKKNDPSKKRLNRRR